MEGQNGRYKVWKVKTRITGGLTYLSCHHGIVKDFTALWRGESPLLIDGPVLRRPPYFTYKNACAAHTSWNGRVPEKSEKYGLLP